VAVAVAVMLVMLMVMVVAIAFVIVVVFLLQSYSSRQLWIDSLAGSVKPKRLKSDCLAIAK
jgi:uncharacterized protein YoxC